MIRLHAGIVVSVFHAEAYEMEFCFQSELLGKSVDIGINCSRAEI